MSFYKDHVVTFSKPKFKVFLMKKSLTSATKMSDNSSRGFHGTHGRLDAGFTIMASYF